MAERSGDSTVQARAQALGAVLHHEQVVLLGDGHHGTHIGHLAHHVHGHDGPRARRDRPLNRSRIDVQRLGDVDDHGGRTNLQDGLYRGDECVGRNDDLVTGTDAHGLEGQSDRSGAGRHRLGMGEGESCSEGRLELSNAVHAIPNVVEPMSEEDAAVRVEESIDRLALALVEDLVPGHLTDLSGTRADGQPHNCPRCARLAFEPSRQWRSQVHLGLPKARVGVHAER